MQAILGQASGQGWLQIVELTFALVLSALIGLERESRQKSAGLRTHALIGFGAALFMLVSKYGFSDVLGDKVILDPSRVAAQIVSGIGFVGGGLIFVRRDLVRGLTTAAAVWLTTAVGMAAGAGLPILASMTTVGYFLVIYGLTPVSDYLGRKHPRPRCVEVIYHDGRGLLREIVNTCTARGWVITQLSTRSVEVSIGRYQAATVNLPSVGYGETPETVSVVIGMKGVTGYDELIATLSELSGVLAINATNPDDEFDPEVE